MLLFDFTLAAYERLLIAITRSGLTVYTVEEYISQGEQPKGIILRHDVERKIQPAIRLAKLENSFGICSTYYFRVPKTFDIEAIRFISHLGHEVGYHYEVLDKTSGDYALAIQLFVAELNEFRTKTGIDIKTACSHGGRPYNHAKRVGYRRNYDIFKQCPELYQETVIIGEAYLDVDRSNMAYFSDSGARWRNCKNVKEIVDSKYVEMDRGLCKG